VTQTSPEELALSVAGAEWFQRPGVRTLLAALNRDGHEARIVGGALRNTLLGLPVGDIDFATTALPDEIIRFARKAGLKSVPTGIDHGTITVIVEGAPYEVTTLRQDVETHGRHATVAFTRDWAADAARRDFTINALYAAADGRVVDPLGGLSDLRARRVRFINSARERIQEDYLRILRFFRFTAEYGIGPPDAEGLAACITERAGLARLSPERIRAEMLRILLAREPMAAIMPMAETGLLTSLLGGVVYAGHFARVAAIEAVLELPPAPIRRLAALAARIEEDAARLSARLRLSNAEAARLGAMAALAPAIHREMADPIAKHALYRLGRERFCDRVLIAWAQSADAETDAAWRRLKQLPDRWTPPSFTLNGQDLMARGFTPGPRMGAALRALEAKWIGSDFSLSREELLRELDSAPEET
jgi:tRNA nucleotidyltransferase/poly(A) polymerase